VKRFSVVMEIWLLVLLICTALALLSFSTLDVPTARYFWMLGRFLHPLNKPLGAPIILAIEAAVSVILVLARLVRGHLSLLAETVAVACLTSICAYAVNSHVLKPLFGVPNPSAVMHGAHHAFHWWKGSAMSSFPSGHMVLAGSLAGVFMRVYRVSRWPLGLLLALAAVLLVVGDWHFVSDIIGGTFLGISAGLLAGQGWAVHKQLPSAIR
jgi:membrane-associated phospholipid phosphatase